MYQSISSIILIGAVAACSAGPNPHGGHHEQPADPRTDNPLTPDAGTVEIDCATVECPLPPDEWCETDHSETAIPQFLVDYWNQLCITPDPTCGDGVLSEDEVCDDGNLTDGDGCSSDCGSVESGSACDAAEDPCP
jgi:cysteine-rich repeat protein